MRAKAARNGVTVKAYAGPSGVMLAMNVDSERRRGLLGFAIHKKMPAHNGMVTWETWLDNLLHFPEMRHHPGQFVPTTEAPIQRFRWSDYRVYTDTTYDYQVHPVYGTPTQLRIEEGPEVQVRTAEHQHEHTVVFNRAVAASQAFARKFPDEEERLNMEIKRAKAEKRKPDLMLSKEAHEWLSRGLLEQIVAFIGRAEDNTWTVDIAIYEYELPEIIAAVEAAIARKASVRVVYHAKLNDEQTKINECNLARLDISQKHARVTSAICHHKFVVLGRIEDGQRIPEAVLCGSTNFTENGVYRQANVAHVLKRRDVAQQYLSLFEILFRGDDPKKTREYISRTNPFTVPQPLFAGFSPRTGGGDLSAFVAEINSARRDVLFATAFDMDDTIDEALLGAPHDLILRYGLQNTLGDRIRQINGDRTDNMVGAAMLSKGLEGFLKESRLKQRGNIFVHTKIIIVDFTSDAPVVISGSHNFSRNASRSNDENYLIIRGDSEVADAYGCELMRLFDHYRFRYKAQEMNKKTVDNSGTHEQTKKPFTLCPDDSWTGPYFEPLCPVQELKKLDRLRFSDEPI